jgi:Cof subfamily protein (haloacid dehalogenase superfamily)
MRFKIIALDLDGTALDSKEEIRPRTKAAVASALAQGVEVALVTGRHHVAARPYHVELGLTSPALCCNGAYVYDYGAEATLTGDALSEPEARWLLQACRNSGADTMIYTDQAMTFERYTAHLRRLTAWAARYPEPIRPDIRQVESFDRVIDEANLIWKFVLSHEDTDVLAEWYGRIGENPDLSVEYSWINRLDIVRSGNTKGGRLVEWARSRGVEPAEILAFGDNQNDVSMIEAVGLGVVMGNGDETAKRAAGLVIGDNNSDALGEAIERLLG